MLAQDFGPVRLILPNVDTAILWRAALIMIKLKSAELEDPVNAHLARALWSAMAAGALSAEHDSEGKPQSWGDLARGKSAQELEHDLVPGASALSGLRDLGAGYSDLINLGDEIVSWLTDQIIAPVEAGEGRARFFARPKAG